MNSTPHHTFKFHNLPTPKYYPFKMANTLREQDITDLLRRIRTLEDQVSTQKKVIAVAKNCLTYLEDQAETTLHNAEDMKGRVQVLSFVDSPPHGTSPTSSSSDPNSSPVYQSSHQSNPSSPTFKSRLRYPPSSPNFSSPVYQPSFNSPMSPPNSSFNVSPASPARDIEEEEDMAVEQMLGDPNMEVQYQIEVDEENNWMFLSGAPAPGGGGLDLAGVNKVSLFQS